MSATLTRGAVAGSVDPSKPAIFTDPGVESESPSSLRLSSVASVVATRVAAALSEIPGAQLANAKSTITKVVMSARYLHFVLFIASPLFMIFIGVYLKQTE